MRMKPLSLGLGSIGLIGVLLISSQTQAAEALLVGVEPAAYTVPGSVSAIPGAFGGTGVIFEADYYLPQYSGGIAAFAHLLPLANLLGIFYKHYLIGRYQEGSPATDPGKVDRRAFPMVTYTRQIGIYLQAGSAFYQVRDLRLDQATAGFGVDFGVGVEYPIFSFLFVGVKTTFFTSLGGPANTLFLQGQVGVPFTF